jgi:hypothetical protein
MFRMNGMPWAQGCAGAACVRFARHPIGRASHICACSESWSKVLRGLGSLTGKGAFALLFQHSYPRQTRISHSRE